MLELWSMLTLIVVANEIPSSGNCPPDSPPTTYAITVAIFSTAVLAYHRLHGRLATLVRFIQTTVARARVCVCGSVTSTAHDRR